MAQPNQNVPIPELFWSLVDKADRRFSRVRDLPLLGRHRNERELHKAFEIYMQLWKMQQEHRQKLMEAGMRRWEVGEIASRVAQLYYGKYQRTSDTSCLAEAFLFYEAILDRDYFRGGGGQLDSALANKQLRFLARFIIVSLVFGRREMITRLATYLRAFLTEWKRSFQETEYKEWKHVVQDIGRFLKADTPFLSMRPLRYSYAFDPHPDSLSGVASGGSKRLSDAILCSYYQNEVKFAELTLDSFRMLQCLEWDPCGSFATRFGAYGTQNETGSNSPDLLKDLRDPALPLNPQKTILYRPSVSHFLTVLATKCEEVPPDGVLLIYLCTAGQSELKDTVSSSSGLTNSTMKTAGSFRKLDISCSTATPSNTFNKLPDQRRHVQQIDNGCLWLGSHLNEGSNFIYPCDLIPFTRRPLFLVIDSSSGHAFKSIHGAEKGETAAILLSPSSSSPTLANNDDPTQYDNGSQFTMFLTAPVQAFCLLIGASDRDIDRVKYNEAERLLSLSLSECATTLVSSSVLHPVWIEALGDPFLRRLLLRFIFFRAILGLFRPTHGQEELLPTCLPELPKSVDPGCPGSQTAVMRLAVLFKATNQFVFAEGTCLSDPDTAEAVIIGDADVHEAQEPVAVSDIPEAHFSAGNGC